MRCGMDCGWRVLTRTSEDVELATAIVPGPADPPPARVGVARVARGLSAAVAAVTRSRPGLLLSEVLGGVRGDRLGTSRAEPASSPRPPRSHRGAVRSAGIAPESREVGRWGAHRPEAQPTG